MSQQVTIDHQCPVCKQDVEFVVEMYGIVDVDCPLCGAHLVAEYDFYYGDDQVEHDLWWLKQK